jgi:hypothetical protein
VDSFVIGFGSLGSLGPIVSDLAVVTVVRHEPGMRSPIGAFAFYVEILAGIAALEPALRPRAGRTKDDDFAQATGDQRSGLHIVSRHPVLTVGERPIDTLNHRFPLWKAGLCYPKRAGDEKEWTKNLRTDWTPKFSTSDGNVKIEYL